ncbi:hypothetical protein JAAARDRAFT_197857 [Jaapia argillacea MUCL 33604]|uniref:Uncharacterized protein n=1 Tax=Jaapia argillacea MUCL 33604 TaxID=933084 RepID=A0A067PE91_9AGAM|nr:hypothetical protein JAAARDRAFT_197857 [Jaapia argillacea MUCL 33604]
MTQEASTPPPPKPKLTRRKRSQSIVSVTPAPPQKHSRKHVVSREYVEVSDEEIQPGPSSGAYANAAGDLAQLEAELAKMRRLQAETQATLERVQIDHGRVLADNEGIKAYLESVRSLLLCHPVQPSPAPRYMPPPGFIQTSLHTPMHAKTSHEFDSPSAAFSFEPHHQLLDNSHDWDLPQPTPSLTPRIYSEAPIHQLSPVAESPNLELQRMPLVTSPTTHSEVVAESPTPADVLSADVPTSDFPTADILRVAGLAPSHTADVPPFFEGTAAGEAEFPPVTGGSPPDTGADLSADFPVDIPAALPPPLRRSPGPSIPLTSTPVRQGEAPTGWVSPIILPSTTPVGSPPVSTLLDISVPRILEPPVTPISPIASPSSQLGRVAPLLTFGADGQSSEQPDIAMDDGGRSR